MKVLKSDLFNYDSAGPVRFVRIAGLSTETKPTAGLVSGSEFLEVDTGREFVLDAESDTAAWTERVYATAEVTPASP